MNKSNKKYLRPINPVPLCKKCLKKAGIHNNTKGVRKFPQKAIMHHHKKNCYSCEISGMEMPIKATSLVPVETLEAAAYISMQNDLVAVPYVPPTKQKQEKQEKLKTKGSYLDTKLAPEIVSPNMDFYFQREHQQRGRWTPIVLNDVSVMMMPKYANTLEEAKQFVNPASTVIGVRQGLPYPYEREIFNHTIKIVCIAHVITNWLPVGENND